jgi:hypothetical protein
MLIYYVSLLHGASICASAFLLLHEQASLVPGFQHISFRVQGMQ